MLASHHRADEALRRAGHLSIRVHREDGCWFLECAPLFQRLIFSSAGAAKAAGRTLAARFAGAGQAVRLAIDDRSGQSIPGEGAYQAPLEAVPPPDKSFIGGTK